MAAEVKRGTRVAEGILSHATKAIEIEDVEARVSALEAATGDKVAHRK